nr:thioredoxin [Halosimplex salinum]
MGFEQVANGGSGNPYPHTFATSIESMTVTLKDFYADWCGPCKTQDPILEDLETEWNDVEFEKINVDEEQDVANEYHVRSLPTLIVENDDGVVERFVGVTQADDIEDALQQASA